MNQNEISTQSIESVTELLKFMNKPAEPLPEVVDLGAVKLVRSNKGDGFYCVTAKSCSCPSAFYRPGQCKHQRKYFPGPKKNQAEIDAESEHKAKWVGGFNGPIDSWEIDDWEKTTIGIVQDPKAKQVQEA